EAARQSVNDLLTGNWGYRAHNYDYPYLGTKEQQEQYNAAYWESIANKSLLEKLFSSRAMDETEEYYREQYNIQNYLQATEWVRQVGRPVMNFLPGGVGLIYNTMDTVESASALFDVTKRLNNGEEFSTEMAMKLIDAGFTFMPVAVSKSISRGGGKGNTNAATISESIPNIKGTQVGLRNPAQIDSMKRDMMNGNYDFKKIDNIIAGYVDSKGNYYITEGHHRMAAAMEIYKKTGNTFYVKKLLSNGKWTETQKPPIDARPLPKR
ncbi:hypothetical protein GQ595_10935, partial [Gilliamella sp. Pra-s54]